MHERRVTTALEESHGLSPCLDPPIHLEGGRRKTRVAGASGSRTFAIVSLLGPCRVRIQSLQIQFSYRGKTYVARFIRRISFGVRLTFSIPCPCPCTLRTHGKVVALSYEH